MASVEHDVSGDLTERSGEAVQRPDGETAAMTKLARFGSWALEQHREYLSGLDGGDLQDTAEAFGLIHRREVTESCGEGCLCVEYGFPADCLVTDTDVQVVQTLLREAVCAEQSTNDSGSLR